MKDSHLKRHTNRPIRILSYKTGRAALAHEIALNEAHFSSVDIILIQEPYIYSKNVTDASPKNILAMILSLLLTIGLAHALEL